MTIFSNPTSTIYENQTQTELKQTRPDLVNKGLSGFKAAATGAIA
jgi:hypothetical protein